MRDTPVLVDYATDGPAAASDRLLRRIVGWLAIVYGGMMLMRTLSIVAIARGWAANLPFQSWELGSGWDLIAFIADATIMAGLLLGGVMLLWRMAGSIILLRIAAACSILLTFILFAIIVQTYGPLGSFFSEPVATAVERFPHLWSIWIPSILLVLTLPPLARRMV